MPDLYSIESAFHLSSEDTSMVPGDNPPSTAASQLRIAPKEHGNSVKGPAKSISIGHEERSGSTILYLDDVHSRRANCR